MTTIRINVQFVGRVQGVGFRYTTVNVARGFKVTGYVRNMLDGSVQCVAEGERDEVRRFIDAVNERMSSYIRNADENAAAATGEFDSFDVRY
ncbi:MAG: acylphosphatase [Phycisphaeraceae bacterium]|nr:acylphosphatase [Phycisphaeraceae bacterium]